MDDPITNPMPDDTTTTTPQLPYGATFLEPNPQPGGDPVAGYEYLVSGDYIGSGIPLDIFTSIIPPVENTLGRTGDNATIAPTYTAFTHSNGTKVVSANCLQCHGANLHGEYMVGLGNINADFTIDQTTLVTVAQTLLDNSDPTPEEIEAFEYFKQGALATGSKIITEVVGANPADRLFEILGAHRDPNTLEWQEDEYFPISNTVVPNDVPAWWLLKKKNAPLYTGMARGNWGKTFMAASTLTLENLEEAEEIQSKFDDVIAYLYSIEAPEYPYAIDESLIQQGKSVFEQNCSGCHGTYGATDAEDTYPNLVIAGEVVGTDPTGLNAGESYSTFIDWYNSSWFNQGELRASLEPTDGYVAQPLDGIWATAPYLHNGSIPTLYHLLKSDARPEFWRRTKDSPYDEEKVGWEFTEETDKTDRYTYDTNIPGYLNIGHTFGDGLSEEDRMAVIEYLKTL